jgi:hypothetical protein
VGEGGEGCGTTSVLLLMYSLLHGVLLGGVGGGAQKHRYHAMPSTALSYPRQSRTQVAVRKGGGWEPGRGHYSCGCCWIHCQLTAQSCVGTELGAVGTHSRHMFCFCRHAYVSCVPVPPHAGLAVFRGHLLPIWDVATAPWGLHFASASADRTARVWGTDNLRTLRILTGEQGLFQWGWSGGGDGGGG